MWYLCLREDDSPEGTEPAFLRHSWMSHDRSFSSEPPYPVQMSMVQERWPEADAERLVFPTFRQAL